MNLLSTDKINASTHCFSSTWKNKEKLYSVRDNPPTLVLGIIQWYGVVLGAVFDLPQPEARQFDLKPAVHQACAGLQVPMGLEAALMNELHSLEVWGPKA